MQIVYANSSLVTEHNGRPVTVTAGEAWSADDTFVAARPELFGPYAGPVRSTGAPRPRVVVAETAARRGPEPAGARDPVSTSVLAVTLTPPDGLNSVSYTESMLRMLMYDASKDGSLVAGGGPMFLPASPNTLPDMRNKACAYVLDESAAEWLLFVDSDMGFSENALEMLLDVANSETVPVVGALCFGLRKQATDMQGGWLTAPFPTIYDWRENEDGRYGFAVRFDYSPDVVTRAAATGAAFLLIHRTVLAAVREQYGDTWFDRGRMNPDEGLMGEDIAFCARIGRMGIPVHVHTGVKTTHLKAVWVSEKYYDEQRVIAMMRQAEDE